jgi:amidase
MSQPTLDLAQASAADTAAAINEGAVSALEACDAAIARIEARDGAVNAVVVRDFERARAQARHIDAERAKGTRLPLMGVPMTVKESHDVAGLPSTWGIPAFKDSPVTQDSVVVERLKRAGAVILGKTNVSTGLADFQSVNAIYGRTVHPRDPARTPGGSSGGAAAALATHMVPLEIGSDIGGSIRTPAHFCGVFGLKPTYGIVPMKGHSLPGVDDPEILLAVIGPLARTATDLEIALDVIAGPLPGSGKKLDLSAARHTRLKDYRVLVLDRHPRCVASVSVKQALNDLADALAKEGADVRRKADIPDLDAAHVAYGKMLRTMMAQHPIDPLDWQACLEEQTRTQQAWGKVFQDIDVVLAPPFGVPAFPHNDDPDWAQRQLDIDGEMTPYAVQVAWAGIATFPGLPATAVPIATTASGLPIGVQIIANQYEDRTSLAFAKLLEETGLALRP